MYDLNIVFTVVPGDKVQHDISKKKTLMSKLYGSVKSLLSGIGILEWQLEGQNNFIHMILTVISLSHHSRHRL